MIPTITIGVTTGKKYIERKNFEVLEVSLTKSASMREINIRSGVISINMPEFSRAYKKLES
jgi:hypothetical protein